LQREGQCYYNDTTKSRDSSTDKVVPLWPSREILGKKRVFYLGRFLISKISHRLQRGHGGPLPYDNFSGLSTESEKGGQFQHTNVITKVRAFRPTVQEFMPDVQTITIASRSTTQLRILLGRISEMLGS
jgi:hypothetical protein